MAPALVAGGLLTALAALSVVNSLLIHMTPSISIYLLHARTFVETLNRFTNSWENKGILLTFLLAPAVRLFGPTVWAAALVQLCAYAVAFYFLYRILRRFAPRSSSWLLVLIGICVVFSPHLWGAKERPEDFALACCAVCLYAALRAAPRWWVAGGAMIGCCALMKITLVAAPAAVLFAAAVADAVQRSAAPKQWSAFGSALFGSLARIAAGFIVVVGLAAAWIALFDDLRRCWLQTVAWPLHSRGRSMLDFRLYVAAARLIVECRLEFLLVGSIAGLACGWYKGLRPASQESARTPEMLDVSGGLEDRERPSKGLQRKDAAGRSVLERHRGEAPVEYSVSQGQSDLRNAVLRRVALLAGIFLAAEFLRIAAEGALFPYLPTLMVIPMLVGASLLGCGGNGLARRSLAWIAPLVLLAPVLATACFHQGRAFELRAVKRLPSPTEYLAERMRPLYHPGETVLVNLNLHEILFLLNAPRPEPLLRIHFLPGGAPGEECRRTARHYAEAPPDWIVTTHSAENPVEFKTIGWLDWAYCVVVRPSVAAQEAAAKQVSATPPRAGRDLTPMVPTSRLYRLEVDIGSMQAWRLTPDAKASDRRVGGPFGYFESGAGGESGSCGPPSDGASSVPMACSS